MKTFKLFFLIIVVIFIIFGNSHAQTTRLGLRATTNPILLEYYSDLGSEVSRQIIFDHHITLSNLEAFRSDLQLFKDSGIVTIVCLRFPTDLADIHQADRIPLFDSQDLDTSLQKVATLLDSLDGVKSFAQDKPKVETEKTLRVNFLNPAVELELPTGKYSTFSSAVGVGYGIGYPDLTYAGSGFIVIISPFVDLQQKWFYNLNKRDRKNKMIANNSGNFVSLRFVSRGNSIASNVYRTSNFDFAIGPTWGLQRTYGKKFHLLFDIGSQYYFDTKGNGNFWPIIFQLNLGFNLEKK